MFNAPLPAPSKQFKNCFCDTICVTGCDCYFWRPLYTFQPFGTSPPFFWSWRNDNNSALFPSQMDGHILQTTVRRPLVTVAGLGGGHMSPAGCFYMLVGRKKFFGGWHCSPSRLYGQPFSHSQGASQYLKQPQIKRGRAPGAEKWP